MCVLLLSLKQKIDAKIFGARSLCVDYWLNNTFYHETVVL